MQSDQPESTGGNPHLAHYARLVAEQRDEIQRLRADNRLLACAYQAWTPDRNTQTPEEVAATEAEIVAAVDRAVPGAIVR